jgi:hypothetical protein
LLIILSCRKEKNPDSPATYVIKNYDSLVLKSYDSIVFVNIIDGEPYWEYEPKTNEISFPFDIDQDVKDDYTLILSHWLYIGDPHFRYTAKVVTVTSLDINYRIAVTKDGDGAGIVNFKTGDTISNAYNFQQTGVIVQDVPNPMGFSILNQGNINIGFRRGSDPSDYRYGYFSMIVEGTKLTLIRTVFNTNKNTCIVQQ